MSDKYNLLHSQSVDDVDCLVAFTIKINDINMICICLCLCASVLNAFERTLDASMTSTHIVL